MYRNTTTGVYGSNYLYYKLEVLKREVFGGVPEFAGVRSPYIGFKAVVWNVPGI